MTLSRLKELDSEINKENGEVKAFGLESTEENKEYTESNIT